MRCLLQHERRSACSHVVEEIVVVLLEAGAGDFQRHSWRRGSYFPPAGRELPQADPPAREVGPLRAASGPEQFPKQMGRRDGGGAALHVDAHAFRGGFSAADSRSSFMAGPLVHCEPLPGRDLRFRHGAAVFHRLPAGGHPRRPHVGRGPAAHRPQLRHVVVLTRCQRHIHPWGLRPHARRAAR